jgi:HEAT repeat protein
MASESDNLPKLADLMLHDPSPQVRAAAAERLGGVGTNEAVNALLRGLGDPDPTVVLSAIDALSFAGDETVVPDLKNLLQHPDPKVREAAKQAIEDLE